MQNINKGFGLLFEMGCGKTLTAIAIAGAGYQMGKVERLLIVAPTSVVAVWPKELQEYAKFKYTCKTLLGEKKQRIKQIDDLLKFPFKALKVAVINYESTWRPEILEKLKEFDADMVIADESQRIKTYDAAQSKAMHELGDQARYKLILSGTPVQTAAIDIWSQYRFLDKTVFGDNFFKFRGRYAIMGGYGNKKIVGYKDLEGLIKKEHSIAFRVTKDEALDLPEQTFETRKSKNPVYHRDVHSVRYGIKRLHSEWNHSGPDESCSHRAPYKRRRSGKHRGQSPEIRRRQVQGSSLRCTSSERRNNSRETCGRLQGLHGNEHP